MKKTLFILFLLVVGIVFVLSNFNRSIDQTLLSANKQTPSPITDDTKQTATKEITSVFVPYWVLGEEITDDYDQLIYFGIAPTTTGIDTTDQGYKSLARFQNAAGETKDTLLTIRMLNNEESFDIIESEQNTRRVISSSIKVAKDYGFEGIVLDLEVNALPFDSVTNNITEFTKQFSAAAKKEGLQFSMAIYGDVYYRLRPFNVKELARVSDQIYIMAYDLHKSRGNPGPNFPFSGKEEYGYDFQTMIESYLKDVPAEKLTVIFGMFGYDWEVGRNGKATSNGEALSYYKIKQQYLTTCSQKTCDYAQDTQSLETKLTYTDAEDNDHIIWFETPTSVAEKKRFIKSKGISGVSYWAYSYF